MQMLSEEVKLWVTRCRQLVGVLQVVEMERDNFKAGEGHAKEMGAGFQVKLAQEDPGSRSSGLSELATELVDTKAELVDTKDRLVAAQAQADWHKVHCDHAYAQLDKHKRQLMFHTTFPPEADSYLALGIFSDQSLSHTNDLHTQLYIAIQTQDKYHREFVVQHYYQHKRLSEYRQKSTEHIAEIADLKIKLKTAIAERDSLLRDYPSEQDTSSDGATQSTESYKALRAEIILANRTLKGTKQAHLASLHYYVGLLDGFVHYIKYSMSQSEIEPIEGYPPSCRSDTLVEEGNQLHPATGISRILTYPARGSFAHIRRKFLSLLTWKRDIMLDSRREEVTEWFGKHMIYELRERESIGDEALEEEIACFRAKVGLDHTGRIVGGPDRDRIGVVTKPSRSDGKALPATWAKMDQLCKGATGSPSSLPDYGYIISTQHGSWPEVLLAINSWSFYKIHDSTFDESFESQELLADLYRIWWHCGGALCGRRVWLDEAEEKNYTRNEPIALDPFPTPSLKKRRVILGYPGEYFLRCDTNW